MTNLPATEQQVYQGQFGEFTITDDDRRGVLIYRSGLMVAALSFAIGAGLVLWQPNEWLVLRLLTPLYTCFCAALAVSLWTIHIYMVPLHRALQVFWLLGAIGALVAAHLSPDPFALTVYQQPLALFAVGPTFVALTGVFFKEAFCFNRPETKLLTPLVPILLLGHLTGLLSVQLEQILLTAWAALFILFALRKLVQDMPADIGDKSVFTYLKAQRSTL